jgi:hypothetical protein
MLMNQRFSFGRCGVLACVVLAATAACSSTLGIDDAHLDPSLGTKAGDSKLTTPASGAVCKPFDNQARLENLLPDGGLMPLPGH